VNATMMAKLEAWVNSPFSVVSFQPTSVPPDTQSEGGGGENKFVESLRCNLLHEELMFCIFVSCKQNIMHALSSILTLTTLYLFSSFNTLIF
jgi:hypothetical protein